MDYTYKMRDLGYQRTPTQSVYRIQMGDGSKWDVPVQVIADSRDAFYADDNEDTIGAIRAGRLSDVEIEDWAGNNMNWSDVEKYATRAVVPAPPINWEEGWANGIAEVIGKL